MTSVTVDDITLEYDEFGDPAAPPVLLIMGLATQMIAWPESFCEDLAGRGFRVIRFDNRDIGLSTKLDGQRVPGLFKRRLLEMLGRKVRVPYTLYDMARDAVGLLEKLGVQQAHVVGVSMGGMIAQLMALDHSHRVRSMTAIMTTNGAKGLPGPDTDVAIHIFARPRTMDREAALRHAVRTWELIGSRKYPTPKEELRAKALGFIERSFYPQGFVRQLAAVMSTATRAADLEHLRLPTLVIHGKEDRLVPVECGMDIARRVPGARLEVIEGMGHDLPRALLPRLADLIAGHIAGVDKAKAA